MPETATKWVHVLWRQKSADQEMGRGWKYLFVVDLSFISIPAAGVQVAVLL